MRTGLPLASMEMAVAMQTGDFPYLPSGLAEVDKMIKEHGDLFSDSQCKVCSAVLISESQKLTHYQSKKHANKVRRYLSLRNEAEPEPKKSKSSPPASCNNGDSDRLKACHICNMTFTCPIVAQSHYQGKVHAKNLRMKSVDFKIPVASQKPSAPSAPPKDMPAEDSGSTMETGSGNGTNSDRFCSICQASFNNPLMAQQHYVGKRHRKQVTKQKLMETYGPSSAPASTLKGYQCTVCKIELNSVEQYQSHISGAKHKNQVKKSSLNLAEGQEAAEESGNDFPADDIQDKSADEYMSEDTEFLDEYQYT